MEKIAVITGTSRGLGEAIASKFLEQTIPVIGVARNENKKLDQLAQKYGTTYHHVRCDLRDLEDMESALIDIFLEINRKQKKCVYLINNAAMIDPIHHSSKLNHELLAEHVQVNVTAPIVFTNQCLNELNKMDGTLICSMITSGAAERAIYGWSAYCSTKAAINMYTKTVGLEQAHLKTNHKIIAFSPGVMDTNMQVEIRSSSPEQFADITTFKQYKEEQKLRKPEEIAKALMQILHAEKEIENGRIYYARDYL